VFTEIEEMFWKHFCLYLIEEVKVGSERYLAYEEREVL
jgi:hypothetical protein